MQLDLSTRRKHLSWREAKRRAELERSYEKSLWEGTGGEGASSLETSAMRMLDAHTLHRIRSRVWGDPPTAHTFPPVELALSMRASLGGLGVRLLRACGRELVVDVGAVHSHISLSSTSSITSSTTSPSPSLLVTCNVSIGAPLVCERKEGHQRSFLLFRPGLPPEQLPHAAAQWELTCCVDRRGGEGGFLSTSPQKLGVAVCSHAPLSLCLDLSLLHQLSLLSTRLFHPLPASFAPTDSPVLPPAGGACSLSFQLDSTSPTLLLATCPDAPAVPLLHLPYLHLQFSIPPSDAPSLCVIAGVSVAMAPLPSFAQLLTAREGGYSPLDLITCNVRKAFRSQHTPLPETTLSDPSRTSAPSSSPPSHAALLEGEHKPIPREGRGPLVFQGGRLCVKGVGVGMEKGLV